MKSIISVIGELMAINRGETKFVTTNSMKHVMRYEVIDNVQ